MSMTLWIHTLDGREMSDESDDHSLMYGLAEELDTVCSAAGKPLLSSFFDMTDLDYNMADEFDDDDGEADEELAIDAETGLGYGIDDMKWFAASDGLATLQALRATVAGGWKPEMDEERRSMLIEELDDCITRLQALPAAGKFHLAVIM
jgi:hypothetical protein